MRILVTGAAGFIGAALSRRLLDRGHEVVGFDDFNDYYDPALKEARAARLAPHPGFRMVRGDLADEAAVGAVFEGGGERPFDVVVNLAAQAGVRYSLVNPGAYVRSNLVGFVNLLELCRRRGLPRLVYASSSSVYGGNEKMPFSEDDRVDAPVSLYAATKKSDELLAHVYSHLFGLQTVGLRFFTVYGPWGRPDMAMWLFADAMLAGRPIKVFNHGKMKRDFTYVDDIVSGVVSCVESDALGPEELFNIGNNRPEELLRLIDVLAGALGVEPKMEMLPMQPGDVPATYADISRIRGKLGFEPTTPIDVGVPAFARWFLDWRAGRRA